MYDYRDDEIDALKRKLEGRPPKKEITLGPESVLPVEELVGEALKILNKALHND